MVGLLDDAVAS